MLIKSIVLFVNIVWKERIKGSVMAGGLKKLKQKIKEWEDLEEENKRLKELCTTMITRF